MRLLFLTGLTVVTLISATAAAQQEKPEETLPLDELLNTKVSTAARYAQETAEAPASVIVITAEEIERYGFESLDQILNSIRGLYTSHDRNYTYLGVRGFSRPSDYNNRILLLINGHSVNENVFGSAALGTDLGLDVDSIERIEFVRGPGSSLYGTGAMLGVINIITKTAESLEGVAGSLTAGSYGKVRAGLVLSRELTSGARIFFSGLHGDLAGQDLHYPEFDRPDMNSGLAENVDFERYRGGLLTFSSGNLTLQADFASRDKAVPTAPFGTLFNEETRTHDERSSVEVGYRLLLGDRQKVLFRQAWDRYAYDGVYPYEEGFSLDAAEGEWLTTGLEHQWDVRSNHKLIVGSEYIHHAESRYRVSEGPLLDFDEDVPYRVFSLYVQDQYQIVDNLGITLGLRYDEHSESGGALSPRIALVYNPNRSGAIKLLYGRAFRSPNTYELHYTSALSGVKVSEGLGREKISTAEIAWEQRLGASVLGSVSLFRTQIDGLIEQQLDPDDGLLQFRNLSTVLTSGAGLELDLRLKRGLWGSFKYSFQLAKEDDSGERLSNSPRHLVKLMVSSPVWKSIRAAADAYYETPRRTVYGTETGADIVTNLTLSSRISKAFRIALAVRNLFDATYSNPGGFEHRQDQIVQDGRNYSLKLAYGF